MLMTDQIHLYHDLTVAWLDRDWKTPREKQLEQENQKLRTERDNLKAQLYVLKVELEVLRSLRVFLNIPCYECGRPMGNWTRDQVLKAFKSWGHTTCIG